MYKVQNLTDDAKQRQVLVLPDGGQILLSLYYIPQQLGWFINELSFEDFTLNGFRIVNSPDMLYQFRNLLPFGLACFSSSGREPQLQQDFITNASELFILDSEEVLEYSRILSGQV